MGDQAGSDAARPAPSRSQWLRLLQSGFSLLVRGVGSKRNLLKEFADDALMAWGAAVISIDGFDARLNLAECLRGVLDQVYPGAPRGGASAEALAGAIRAARKAAEPPVRPLAFVVHNVEVLSGAHQEVLAGLAAAPGIHLVASVDSIWAGLQWSTSVLQNFNFCYQEVHTWEPYEVEVARRYPGGTPAWSDPCADRQSAPKASLGLVLRSLTGNHRELVQAIAEFQLGAGLHAGIPTGKLLAVATDRMIASNLTKLKGLLMELTDHEALVQRNAPDGSTLYLLPCDQKTLQRLADGLPPEDEDED